MSGSGDVSTRRPILVLAAPRSGSSWFAATLGRSPSVVYRREPLTQAAIDRGEDPFAHRSPDTITPAARREIETAFAARAPLRALVKEVTPLRAPVLVSVAEPVVVELTRHPLAIAASQHARGWNFANRVPMRRFAARDADLVAALKRLWPAATVVERTVAYTAASLVAQRRSVPQSIRARYEDFVADVKRFAGLADRLHIAHPRSPRAGEGGDRSDAYRTDRPGSPDPHHWRSTITDAHAVSCRSIWRSFGLADYDDATWRLAIAAES